MTQKELDFPDRPPGSNRKIQNGLHHESGWGSTRPMSPILPQEETEEAIVTAAAAETSICIAEAAVVEQADIEQEKLSRAAAAAIEEATTKDTLKSVGAPQVLPTTPEEANSIAPSAAADIEPQQSG